MAIKKHDLVNWTPIDSTNPLKSLAHEVNLNLDAIQAAIAAISTASGTGPMNAKTYFPGSVVNNITTVGQVITTTTFTTTGNNVFIIVTGDANPQAHPQWMRLQLYRNGTAIGKIVQVESAGSNINVPYCLHHIDNPPTGTHTYSMQVQSGTGTWQFGEGDAPAMSIIELTGAQGPGVGSTVVQNSITLGATTTAPGVGTRTVQRIEAQTIGDKVRLTYKLGQVAVSAGSGSYLLSLPTGMSFNTTYNPVWTGAEWTGGVSAVAPYHIPATGGITIDGNWTNQIIVVPYDSTRFRLMLTNNNSQQTFMFWNQGWYAASASTGIDLQLSFEIWK